MLDVHGPRLTMMAKRIRDLLEPMTAPCPAFDVDAVMLRNQMLELALIEIKRGEGAFDRVPLVMRPTSSRA